MFQLKECLSKQDKFKVSILIKELPDYFGEFYLTKKKIRLFIKDNLSSLFSSLNKGDKLLFDDTSIAIVSGYAEKTIEIEDYITKEKKIIPSRKYVTLLAKDTKSAQRIIEFIDYQLPKETLYCKLKKNNPLLNLFYANGWVFRGNRGNEILISRNSVKVPYIPWKDFEEN